MITREEVAEIIGANVTDALKALGATYAEAAELAELSPKTVQRAASGEVAPNSWTIAKLASAFYCEPADIDPTLAQLKEHGAKPPRIKKRKAA